MFIKFRKQRNCFSMFKEDSDKLLHVSNHWVCVLFDWGLISHTPSQFPWKLPWIRPCCYFKVFSQVSRMTITSCKWLDFFKKNRFTVTFDANAPMENKASVNIIWHVTVQVFMCIGFCVISTAIYFFVTPICLEIIWFELLLWLNERFSEGKIVGILNWRISLFLKMNY